MSLQPATALVVDDDPILQAVLGNILRKRHTMVVLQAENGIDACRLVDSCEDPLSLLVCDLNMPECDGVEFVQRLSARQIRVPIIFVTGAKATIARSASVLASATGFEVLATLSKPVDTKAFSQFVDKALSGQQQRVTA